jgi:hypothetical protein
MYLAVSVLVGLNLVFFLFLDEVESLSSETSVILGTCTGESADDDEADGTVTIGADMSGTCREATSDMACSALLEGVVTGGGLLGTVEGMGAALMCSASVADGEVAGDADPFR